MEDWIDILPTPLPTTEALHFVSSPNAGGISLFLGTTRTEKNAQGHDLLALDYEAYLEMALPQLQTLAQAARSQWPIVKQVILHRTGRVPLSEPSVLIAVASPHRHEAFSASRFIIDAIKADVAIWKKEIWSDGSGTWVHSNIPGPNPP
ncbi:MAG TPA: molybdenum cofactor biosynthesis protein MoaE [Tepidisphaeraceae bacterium]|jgi:molybdopterin synthase catalytic subunit|nr:molybdenum cofactor biosynthesis protein MoaE [Tepidisphaeraceae bacterium]